MMFPLRAFALLAAVVAVRSDVVTTVELNGKTFVNKGLVAFGLIPANFTDSTGDTMGGFGSAIAIKPGTWKMSKNGTYEGVLVVHPDRGYNVISTVNYQSRHHLLAFTLSPYYSDVNLSFADAQQTLKLDYLSTTLKYERENRTTTGLDALGVRNQSESALFHDPQAPIASATDDRITLDVEGLIANDDGTYWISDEYGPYIYRFTGSGHLINMIQPPAAFIPLNASGDLNFTSEVNPVTGRQGNQGFEGLTLDRTTSTLYGLLQSATIQDGGSKKSTSRYTRLIGYDVTDPSSPKLKEEYVVPLPQDSSGDTLAASELHFVEPHLFLALSRDSDGAGGNSDLSSYKQAGLVYTGNATNIAGTAFDTPELAVSPKGVLNSTIVPATYVGFVNYINATQLARFGLHNGDPDDETLIASKWESLALASVEDPAYPDDYFLFTVCDNDFLTTDGVSIGVPYNAGQNVDNQFLVFRITLPGIDLRQIC